MGEGVVRKSSRSRPVTQLIQCPAAAEAALTGGGLADNARKWPSVLSGGQKKHARVALARALGRGPRVLAFDEPLGQRSWMTRIREAALFWERVWAEKTGVHRDPGDAS